MNTYLVQYTTDSGWVALSVRDTGIDAVLDWVKATIQRTGICVSLLEELPEQLAPCWDYQSNWTAEFRSRQRNRLTF